MSISAGDGYASSRADVGRTSFPSIITWVPAKWAFFPSFLAASINGHSFFRRALSAAVRSSVKHRLFSEKTAVVCLPPHQVLHRSVRETNDGCPLSFLLVITVTKTMNDVELFLDICMTLFDNGTANINNCF